MTTIILAAGRGSRLENETKNKPKCLTVLANKTLLKWQINALRKANILNIYLVRGYLKKRINEQNINFIDNHRWAKTNMVYSLLLAKEILKKHSCIIAYSDIVYHPSIILKLLKDEHDISVAYDINWKILWKLRFENPFLDAESFLIKNNRIVDIGRKTNSYKNIQGQYMGLLKTTPFGWNKIEIVLNKLLPETVDSLDVTSLLRLLLENNIEIRGVPVKGKWCEVDYLSDLKKYEDKIKSRWTHDWR